MVIIRRPFGDVRSILTQVATSTSARLASRSVPQIRTRLPAAEDRPAEPTNEALTDFDSFADAGERYIVVQHTFTTTANREVVARFTSGLDQPLVNGIVVTRTRAGHYYAA